MVARTPSQKAGDEMERAVGVKVKVKPPAKVQVFRRRGSCLKTYGRTIRLQGLSALDVFQSSQRDDGPRVWLRVQERNHNPSYASLTKPQAAALIARLQAFVDDEEV